MNDIHYYISNTADPKSDIFDNQELLNRRGLLDYEIDSIIETIGTRSCGMNIDVYLTLFLKEMNDDEKSKFLNRVIKKIEEVYNITTFENLNMNMFQLVENKGKLLKDLLMFFEKEGWVKIFARCFPTDTPKLFWSDKCREFVLANYEKFVNQIGFFRDDIPAELMKFFQFAPKEEVVESICRIIATNRIAIAAEQVTIEMEKDKHVDDQNKNNDDNKN